MSHRRRESPRVLPTLIAVARYLSATDNAPISSWDLVKRIPLPYAPAALRRLLQFHAHLFLQTPPHPASPKKGSPVLFSLHIPPPQTPTLSPCTPPAPSS